MECPKCGHAQDDTIKCESCGVYFAKLHPPETPRASAPRSGTGPAPERSGLGVGALVVTALLTAAAVFALMRNHGTAPAGPASSQPDVAQRPPEPIPAAESTSAPTGLAAQLNSAVPPRNAIEAARNATVFIKTGWGMGSGFILDEDCHVITNRHVVETDGARVASRVVEDPQVRARIASTQQQLQAQIYREQRLRRALTGQPGTNLEQLELDNHIEAMQRQLADLPGRLSENISEQVEGAGRNGFTVILADGTQYDALHADYADGHDLALFTLPASHCPHVTAGRSLGLALGERLYTIGNPSGLTYTVTSGVFSGHRGQGSQRLLQTDAPINPGNSGGPLVTENGRVVGINSMVMRGVQGIGFAIPIEAVYEEFSELRGSDSVR
jgi:S1-C subfamily serine protease